MKRSLAVLAALALALTACGSDPAADPTDEATTDAAGDPTIDATDAAATCEVDQLPLAEPDQLTVATGDPVFAPWMIDNDPTNGQGFESAVVYALAEEMGFSPDQVTWTATGFDEAIAPGEKPYDFNIQQYSITEDRDEVVDFSEPYYVAQRAVVAMEGSSAEGATNFADLQDVSFGATTGTVDLAYIEDELGLDPAVYNTQADTQAAMAAGQVEATVVNLPSALYLTAVEIEDSFIVGVLPDGRDEADALGLLLPEGSALKLCIDEAMVALRDAGTLDELADEWLVESEDLPVLTR